MATALALPSGPSEVRRYPETTNLYQRVRLQQDDEGVKYFGERDSEAECQAVRSRPVLARIGTGWSRYRTPPFPPVLGSNGATGPITSPGCIKMPADKKPIPFPPSSPPPRPRRPKKGIIPTTVYSQPPLALPIRAQSTCHPSPTPRPPTGPAGLCGAYWRRRRRRGWGQVRVLHLLPRWVPAWWMEPRVLRLTRPDLGAEGRPRPRRDCHRRDRLEPVRTYSYPRPYS